MQDDIQVSAQNGWNVNLRGQKYMCSNMTKKINAGTLCQKWSDLQQPPQNRVKETFLIDDKIKQHLSRF